jgi:hypothetical protein
MEHKVHIKVVGKEEHKVHIEVDKDYSMVSNMRFENKNFFPLYILKENKIFSQNGLKAICC